MSDELKTAAVAAGGGILAWFGRALSRRKDFWKTRFEAAQKLVDFWQENGLELMAQMTALQKSYNELNNKYAIVVQQNIGLKKEIAELRKEIRNG